MIKDKISSIKKCGRDLLDSFCDSIKTLKENSIAKISKEIINYRNLWENEFNTELINNTFSKSKISNLKKYNLPKLDILNKVRKSKSFSSNKEQDDEFDNLDLNQTIAKSFINSPIFDYYSNCLQQIKLNLSNEEIHFFTNQVLNNKKWKLHVKYKLNERKKGYSVKKFNKNCLNKEKILVLCESENGNIFGGYNDSGWGLPLNKHSNNFIFHLTKQTIHKQRHLNESDLSTNQTSPIMDHYGPCFGDEDLLIGDNGFLEKSSRSKLGKHFQYDGSDGDTYLAGTSEFRIKKCIIYQLKYID